MRIAPPLRAAASVALLLVIGTGAGGCSVSVAGVPSAAPAVAGVPAPDPAGGGALFEDPLGRFALVPPEGWTVDASGVQRTTVVFLDPQPTRSDAGSFSANINVIVVPSEATLPDTVTGARAELQRLTGYSTTADEPVTLADGTPAHVLGGTFSDTDSGFDLRNMQLFAVADGSTIIVTGTALLDAWDAYASVFGTSLRTLTVTP